MVLPAVPVAPVLSVCAYSAALRLSTSRTLLASACSCRCPCSCASTTCQQYIGDGNCDNGVVDNNVFGFDSTGTEPFNFDCEAFDNDGGDCALDCHQSIYHVRRGSFC
jgi:hypothetical protein